MPNVSDAEDWTKLSAELLEAVSSTSFIGVTVSTKMVFFDFIYNPYNYNWLFFH